MAAGKGAVEIRKYAEMGSAIHGAFAQVAVLDGAARNHGARAFGKCLKFPGCSFSVLIYVVICESNK